MGDCLTLPVFEAPVDRGDAMLFCDGQDRVKSAANGACHIFGAQNRAVVSLQSSDLFFEIPRPTVVVEGQDIGVLQLDRCHRRRLVFGSEIILKDAAGERLLRVCLSRPWEHLWKKLYDFFRICWFVPDVPRDNTLVFGKLANNALNILQRILESRLARTLNPAGIMDARNRRMLRTKPGLWFPARIKQDKYRMNVVFVGDGQKIIVSLSEATWILLP